MHARVAPMTLAVIALSGLFSPQSRAFEASDPFATAASTPPRPLLSGAPAENTVAPCAPPRAEAPLGVVEVVEQALCNNPQTRQVWANARVQAAQVGVAQAAYLPSLDGSVGVARVTTDAVGSRQRNASLTLSWLLFDFGARAANLENARQLLVAAAATLDATVQTVFLAALQSYYNVQAARAALTAAQESEKANRESLTAAEVRYQVGTGTPADRLQAQTAWSQATLNRIRAAGNLQNAFGTLANVMGLDASAPLRLDDLPALPPDAAFAADVAALIDAARQDRPDLKAAEAQSKAAQSGVDFARASGRPTVSLGAGPSWQQIGDLSRNASSLGVTVNLPLFSGFNTTYRVRAAEAQSEATTAQRDRLRLQIALDVWQAYQSLITATQSLKTTADLLASAEQSARVALGRYQAGVGNILDLLNAQSALAAARQQRIQATLDWRVFRATLAQAIGTLDSRLLQPPAAGQPSP
jgi:outer membrane protein